MNYFELISQINWRFLFLIWHVLKSNAYNIRKKLKKVKNYFHFFPGLLTCIYNLRISLIIPGFRSQEMFVFSISQKSLSLAFHPVSPALDASLTPGGAPGWHPALQGIILNLKPASLLLQGFAFPAEKVTQISWDSKAGPVPPAALPCPVPADPGPCRCWWLAGTMSCLSSLQAWSICFVLWSTHCYLASRAWEWAGCRQ